MTALESIADAVIDKPAELSPEHHALALRTTSIFLRSRIDGLPFVVRWGVRGTIGVIGICLRVLSCGISTNNARMRRRRILAWVEQNDIPLLADGVKLAKTLGYIGYFGEEHVTRHHQA